MAKVVIKKGGEREKFDPQKIERALNRALAEVSLSLEKKSEIVKEVLNKVLEFVEDKKEIATAEIEAKILLELDKILPESAQKWREYRLKKHQK